ncbi:MAG: hypothetical protein M2R45_04828 [Verrucomicrobia subdivision 3 bacterium]|nr:hypothetical protein [Limisphaerales bacterium]
MAGSASNTKVVGFAGRLATAAMGAVRFITPPHLLPMREAGFLIRKALEYGQQITIAPKVKHRFRWEIKIPIPWQGRVQCHSNTKRSNLRTSLSIKLTVPDSISPNQEAVPNSCPCKSAGVTPTSGSMDRMACSDFLLSIASFYISRKEFRHSPPCC